MAMKTAIGTKVIRFESMTLNEFAEKFNRPHMNQSDEDQQGYHVQYNNPDGSVYDSWSPKNVFEAAYHDVELGMTFGDALFFLKQGKKVARKGWGEGVYIEIKDNTFRGQSTEGVGIYFCDSYDEGRCTMCDPEFLAEDWVVVDA